MMINELHGKIEELERKHEHLTMENEMLADYLLRHQQDGGTGDDSSGPSTNTHTKKGGKQPKVQTLSLEERFKIANSEVETLNKDIESTKKASDQNLDVLKALMEETDIRIAEIKRDAYEFRRDIVVGAENFRTAKTMAEKVLKYLEAKLTAKDTLINKLLMKNNAIKQGIRKAESQLKSKEAGGDDLQYIDFHQLQIENQQFVLRIEEANQELIQLKRTSGRTVKVLNAMKKRLNQLTSEAFFFRDEIKERRAMLTKSESDLSKVMEEKEIARRDNKRLRVRVKGQSSSNSGGGGGPGGADGPQVLDYLNQKAEEYELQNQKATLSKKAELAHVAWLKAKSVARQQNLHI